MFLLSYIRRAPLLPVYLLSLLLMALIIGTFQPSISQLRGGVPVLLLLISLSISATAVAILMIFRSPMATVFKVGLLLLQGAFLWPWATVLATMLPVMLFFGLGTCSSTFTSPSGAQTVTIDTSCFMGCTNILYRDDYIFQTQVGGLSDTSKLCNQKEQIQVNWNADETVTEWQINGQKETIRIK